MDNRIIGIISAATNLDQMDIKYEVDMLDFSSKLFEMLKKENVGAYLFGGTALNKGFFKERQRLSRDIGLEIDKHNSFINTVHKIESCIIKSGYPNFRVNENKGRHTVYVFIGEEANELKIDLFPQQNSIKPVSISLHSILEYAGLPSKTIEVYSYPFEYLLAYKLSALHRLMLYKDIYDSYMGLQMPIKKYKMLKYIRMFGRTQDIIKGIINNIESGDYDRDELNYEKLVQEKYRVPLKNMLYEIRAKLKTYFSL